MPSHGQGVSQLQCQGAFGGAAAAVEGERQYAPYNALGDGFVRFSGILKVGSRTARMMYEGYTRNAPFRGILLTDQGNWSISVLDATGGGGQRMLIYDAKPSLGPPTILGDLVCAWR
jgi:hypothetical protein